MRPPLRIAALIGGGGRTLLNLADSIDAGSLDAGIVLVLAPRAGLPGVERARERGLDVRVAAGDEEIASLLRAARPDLVCLCGYLKKLRIDPGLEGCVMNIHPALLPDFGGPGMYGRRVHEAVLAAGRSESGCTVHFADDVYDHGPIILRRRCPVLPGDDPDALAARVFALECEAYPEAIRLFGAGRIRVVKGRVAIGR